jgi:cobalt-zinc-cadmium efflux system outer membrane protein
VAQQAGLYPNPTLGYTGELMGVQKSAGEMQGGFVRQTIVTAGKLKLSRSKYLQEVAQNQLHALAQRERVLNGVRVHYVRLLAAQRLAEVQQSLLRNADDSQLTTQEMLNVGQANRAQMLQAQVAARRKKVEVAQTEIQVLQARRDLAAFVGVPCLPGGPIAGALEARGDKLEWNKALAELVANSPELSVAQLEVRKDQIQLQREQAQPYPNIQLEAATGYDFENPGNVASATVGIEVPLFNRNQGTIRQAQAEVTRSSAEAHRVELALRHRLAEAFQQYDAAVASVDDFEAKSLRDAEQADQLLLEAYQQRRTPWTEVLQAERIYFELSQEYVHDLRELREAEIAIKGLLLVGGLEAPGAPVGNHIDATPQPR